MLENNDYDDLNSENEEYILEGICGDSVGIKKEIKKKLLKKEEKATCKIKNTNTNFSKKGFFCKIPFNNNKNIIKILFTTNHILNKESLQIGEFIDILYKGDPKTIELTKDRLVVTDSRDYKIGLDYSCIEIFDSDIFMKFLMTIFHLKMK